jgi:hypothetical protein
MWTMAATAFDPRADIVGTLRVIAEEAVNHGWTSADDDELLTALGNVTALRNQVDALAGQIAVAAETRGATMRAGSRNAATWTGANTNGSPARIRHDARLTRWLLDYADFRDAYAAGDLSRQHVDALRNAERPTTRWALYNDQAMLVGFARDLSLDDFTKALQYWVNAADPDGTIPDQQIMRNRLRLRRRIDGSGTIDGELDPLLMTQLHEAIEREIKRLRAHDQDTGVRRTNAQLRVAALASLVERGAARADGSTGNPLLKIVLGEKLAEQLLLADADPQSPITPSFFDEDYRCEFLDGTPLHPQFAKALLGVAEFRRMVLSAESRNLDVSVNTRTFPQWMRDAALVTTRGRCSELGCDAHFHWLHMDHRKPVAKGGETSFRNLDPLCSESNRQKSDRWTEPPDAGP